MKNIGKIMIDAKIHGKFIFAEIKLDQADCKNSFGLQELVRIARMGKFEFWEDF